MDLVARMMVSGLMNGLGRASLVLRDEAEADRHFAEAVRLVTPDADTELVARARGVQERANLGLLPDAVRIVAASKRAALDMPTARRIAAVEREQAVLSAAIAGPLLSMPGLRAATVAATSNTQALLSDCLSAEDPMLALANVAEDLSPVERTRLHILVADHYQKDDPLMAIDALTAAAEALPPGHPALRLALSHRLLAMNLSDVALRGLVQDLIGAPGLWSSAERDKLLAAFTMDDIASKGHGHVVLLTWLRGLGAATVRPGQVVIEIGTTRENVPNQGSTAILGQYCADMGLRFITVDMDPYNTGRAAQMFERAGWQHEAVTSKGEDYLQSWQGSVDHVFLDAYDFDHGKHSERRQQRYETYLGSRIDELQCHQMHLDCAKSLVRILSETGTICIDDTWQDDSGAWTAKGTTAVPYLLKNGFEVVEARNNAVLLRRKARRKASPRKPPAEPKAAARKAPARRRGTP